MLSVFSCEKQMFVLVNCEDCTDTEPEFTQLLVKVNSRPPLGTVIVRVYEGNDTSSPLILTYTTQSGDERRIDAALNRTYTLEAEYKYAGKTYRVTDMVRPSVKYTKSECDEPCYYVYNNLVNLRLKYF